MENNIARTALKNIIALSAQQLLMKATSWHVLNATQFKLKMQFDKFKSFNGNYKFKKKTF